MNPFTYPPTEARPSDTCWELPLSPKWKLSTCHPSSEGRPVLVETSTGIAYDPGDLVALAPNHHRSARQIVAQLQEKRRIPFTADEEELVGQFLA